MPSLRLCLQVVELVALDGRPRIEGLEVSATNCASVRGNAKVKRGKWYYEVLLRSDTLMQIGWCSDGFAPDAARNKGVGDDESSWAFDGCRLLLRWNKNHKPWGKKPWKEADVVGCLLNLDESEMQFSINGKLLKVPNPEPYLCPCSPVLSPSSSPLAESTARTPLALS